MGVVGALFCPDCGKFVRRDIKFDKNGNPYWVCPECGVVRKDRRWYKHVNQEQYDEIRYHRGPRGRFVYATGYEYIGIDNRDGDIREEEFPDLLECLLWLADEKELRA